MTFVTTGIVYIVTLGEFDVQYILLVVAGCGFVWGTIFGMLLMNLRMVQRTHNKHNISWDESFRLYYYLLSGKEMK